MDIYFFRLISIVLILLLSSIWLFMYFKSKGSQEDKNNIRKRGLDHHSMGPLFLDKEGQGNEEIAEAVLPADAQAAPPDQASASAPASVGVEEKENKASKGLGILGGLVSKNKQKQDTSNPSQPPPKKKNEDVKIICLQLHARKQEGFNGHTLLSIFERHDLEFGKMDVFHRQVNLGGQDKHAFSVINGEEPGTLIPEEIKDKSTQRIMFYISLNECYNPLKSFDDMLDVAQKFAVSLDGLLCDDQGCGLSEQNIEYQRDLVREFVIRHRLKVAVNE